MSCQKAPEERAKRLPEWLKRRMPRGAGLHKTAASVRNRHLPTVCEEARCPNLTECWSKKTATFLAMGKDCTRNCGFCDIDFSKTPAPLEADEPQRILEAVKELGLRHVVITMVARDDLADGGAEHLGKIVEELRRNAPTVTIEVLTSDFAGNFSALDCVLASGIHIFNHNLETVRALTPRVRHKATYDRTLSVLEYVHQKSASVFVKSGLMVGLGETEAEVYESLNDLKNVGCQIVTMGQYLQPSKRKLLVKSFVTPEQFEVYANYGRLIGIPHMYCGPFVRSSYNAGEVFNTMEQSEK